MSDIDEVVILVSSCAMTKYITVLITFCNKKKTILLCACIYILSRVCIGYKGIPHYFFLSNIAYSSSYMVGLTYTDLLLLLVP